MKNEDRIVELLAELVQKQDVFAEKLDKVSSRLEAVIDEVHNLREDMNGHNAKTNAGLNEVRLSVMRLADKLDKQDEIEKRLTVIEKIVLK